MAVYTFDNTDKLQSLGHDTLYGGASTLTNSLDWNGVSVNDASWGSYAYFGFNNTGGSNYSNSQCFVSFDTTTLPTDEIITNAVITADFNAAGPATPHNTTHYLRLWEHSWVPESNVYSNIAIRSDLKSMTPIAEVQRGDFAHGDSDVVLGGYLNNLVAAIKPGAVTQVLAASSQSEDDGTPLPTGWDDRFFVSRFVLTVTTSPVGGGMLGADF